ncbi:family 4 putative glycosyltransferase [Podospora australis]|uniref:Family 4 putative glycosyltransferase n=1 Tax=Podospora australis TaxID=1536484 RepID=A0AAN7AKZ0_9PEZI|nr:family 4 putative glycosyltransferase [Podospora australis]
MASFFQLPTSGDPVLAVCNPPGPDGLREEQHRQVYCNKVLTAEQRLQTPLQFFTLIFAAICLGLPLLYWALSQSRLFFRRWNKKRKTKRRRPSPISGKHKNKSLTSLPSSEPRFLASVQALHFLGGDAATVVSDPDSSINNADHPERHAWVVELTSLAASASLGTHSSHPEGTVLLGRVKVQDVDRDTVSGRVNHLAKLVREDHTLSGVVLRVSDVPEDDDEQLVVLNHLVSQLHDHDVPVILNLDHDDDELIECVDFGMVSGLIVDNACILPSGERRDFFRSYGLRNMMAQCAGERIKRPWFFVGFHDLWDIRPSSSVVVRGEKLARHFEAVYGHGPFSKEDALAQEYPEGMPRSISGFEYLRKPETTDLQKSWTEQRKKVWLGPQEEMRSDEVASLDVEELDSILPNIEELLKHTPVTEESELEADVSDVEQQLSLLTATGAASTPQPSAAFWETTVSGDQLSSLGCVPINVNATSYQYEAVLATQEHLRDLEMLHCFDETEINRVIEQLRAFQPSSAQPHLVKSLVESLAKQKVVVYKGLATGLSVPDNAAEFWGISGEDESRTDIFISRRCPSDLNTILHTWLAHHGVPRIERYEEELRLERSQDLGAAITLPLAIRTSIEGATPAEALTIIQRLETSLMSHPFKQPIQEQCRTLLLDESALASWNDTHSRQYLKGTITMAELLQNRLKDFTRQGACTLPTLENLLHLHDEMEKMVDIALFSGDGEPLNQIGNALTVVYDPLNCLHDCEYVDVNAELLVLIFICALRKAALNDVYIEATDHCPVFTQPDQAAVFSELWVLGSQCELYFCMKPRALGRIIYDRHHIYLEQNPPPVFDSKDERASGLMTVYAKPEPSSGIRKIDPEGPARQGFNIYRTVERMRKATSEFGALSIFCLPAMLDIILLSFLGRGLFMTAYMGEKYLTAACYALLISLLLSAGVTGWVGSVGNYYACNYAYNNMVFFHVQRFSGGFALSILVGVVGTLVFAFKSSVGAAFVWFAYLILISTYLNVLGIMATMHQHGTPLTSGRTVLWRTMPLLFISPIISTYVNGHDLTIYLSVGYGFLLLLLVQYRSLCHEWIHWMDHVPKFTEQDIVSWYNHRMEKEPRSGHESSTTSVSGLSPEQADEMKKQALQAFRETVAAGRTNIGGLKQAVTSTDPLVRKVVKGLPYIEWLLKKDATDDSTPALIFSVAWFSQLSQAFKRQQQMSQGLKEHSIFWLFRYAKLDIGQNVGLFLICLMDRWVSITMAANSPPIDYFTTFTSRYAICFAILYFCAGVMTLDNTLREYWKIKYELSDEKLATCEDAEIVARNWERARRQRYVSALFRMLRRMMFIMGFGSIMVWLLVDNQQMIELYFLYLLGYSGVIMFQFNRCFTTDPSSHLAAIFVSAIFGFVTGCMLHAVFHGNKFFFIDVIALNVASLTAFVSTTVWASRDFGRAGNKDNREPEREPTALIQPRLGAPPAASEKTYWKDLDGHPVSGQETAGLSQRILAFLRSSIDHPSKYAEGLPWSRHLLEVALQFWQENRLHITICSRSTFIEAGFEDAVSISQLDGEHLHINIDGLGEMELGNLSWELLAARVIAESILHHVARSWLDLTTYQAVQAEHILYGTEILAKRIELQVASDDYSSLVNIKEDTRRALLKQLCFGMEIDSEWDLLPTAARHAMVQRMHGERPAPSKELLRWMIAKGVDMTSVNFQVEYCYLVLDLLEETFEARGAPSYSSNGIKGAKTESFHSRYMTPFLARILNFPVTLAKWTGIVSGGGSHLERELWYNLRHYPRLRTPVMYVVTFIWRGCWYLKNACTSLLLIYRHAALVNISRLARKGAQRTIVKDRVNAELRRRQVTGFASRPESNDSNMTLEIFEGFHSSWPENLQPMATAIYDDHSRLVARRDVKKEGTPDAVTTYTYQENTRSRYPASKAVSDDDLTKQCFYDKKGRITQGTMTFSDGTEYAFWYFWKSNPKGSHELLKAEFRRAQPASNDSLSVFWGTPLREDLSEKLNWIPSDRVCRVVRVINGKEYVTTSDYQHRRDPVMMTVVEEENGTKTATGKPPVVFDLEHEALFLVRPSDPYFENDDLLIHHRADHVRRMAKFCGRKLSWVSLLNPAVWIYRRKKTIYRPVPTWWLRTELWDHWRKSGVLDAIAACWMDELILREEPLLKKYWSARNKGQLDTAKKALESKIEQIVSAIEIEKDVSEVCLLPIKSSDLYAMGLGRDANQLTMRPDDCFKDTHDRISVIFNDIGCWPDSPGGVSNCRRDLVNGHSTIRNHVLAESANEFGIPRFQVEKSVQSLKMLPLWGLDGRTPNHGVIDNLLESEVDAKIAATDMTRDVAGVFVPLLKAFVKGARSRHISRQDMIKYSNAMIAMFEFFEHKDYNDTWLSKEVYSAWIEAWLTKHGDSNIVDSSTYFELEKPSMTDFKTTLDIFTSYFFIFSVQTPEDCPKVFQSTHHGISSLFGMLLKYRRGATFGIWDHAILWRECCLNISPAQSTLPLPVQSMLLAGIGLAMKLAYFHADVVLPCTPVFNPIWEEDLGTDGNRLGHKKTFSRKIDPIVNGVSNMDAFKPVEKVGTSTPTVVMLSNVQFIKDIKTAILAADVIVNKFGFPDYKLLVYGARDREPGYDIDMSRLIESCGLSERVILKGFGKPDQALKDAWLFMNSSLSEGLPLAIAEAALAGVPIVATAVGATALVLTNPDDPSVRYGEVVPPNDPTALARAQIAMLAMAGPWSKFAGDVDRRGSVPPHLLMPDTLTENDVKWLTKRMYDKAPDRRKLGMLGRQMVLRGFHGKRYLREHEQMYWIQWHLAHMRKDPLLSKPRGWMGPLWNNNHKGEGGGGEDGGEKEMRLTRKKSVRWQEFTSGITPYRGKRLSKLPLTSKEGGEASGSSAVVSSV